jgi:hypothetical protein
MEETLNQAKRNSEKFKAEAEALRAGFAKEEKERQEKADENEKSIRKEWKKAHRMSPAETKEILDKAEIMKKRIKDKEEFKQRQAQFDRLMKENQDRLDEQTRKNNERQEKAKLQRQKVNTQMELLQKAEARKGELKKKLKSWAKLLVKNEKDRIAEINRLVIETKQANLEKRKLNHSVDTIMSDGSDTQSLADEADLIEVEKRNIRKSKKTEEYNPAFANKLAQELDELEALLDKADEMETQISSMEMEFKEEEGEIDRKIRESRQSVDIRTLLEKTTEEKEAERAEAEAERAEAEAEKAEAEAKKVEPMKKKTYADVLKEEPKPKAKAEPKAEPKPKAKAEPKGRKSVGAKREKKAEVKTRRKSFGDLVSEPKTDFVEEETTPIPAKKSSRRSLLSPITERSPTTEGVSTGAKAMRYNEIERKIDDTLTRTSKDLGEILGETQDLRTGRRSGSMREFEKKVNEQLSRTSQDLELLRSNIPAETTGEGRRKIRKNRGVYVVELTEHMDTRWL